MQFKSVFVLLAVATSNVLAAANSDQTVSDINAIAEKTRITKKAIDNYNGGITGALMISRAIYNAHTTAETARRNLHGADPFADDDGGKMLEAYDEMYPLLIDTLKSAQKKAPLVKQSGLGYGAQGMVSNLDHERADLEAAMHGQLSRNHSQMVQPSMDQVNRAFKDTMRVYRD